MGFHCLYRVNITKKTRVNWILMVVKYGIRSHELNGPWSPDSLHSLKRRFSVTSFPPPKPSFTLMPALCAIRKCENEPRGYLGPLKIMLFLIVVCADSA